MDIHEYIHENIHGYVHVWISDFSYPVDISINIRPYAVAPAN